MNLHDWITAQVDEVERTARAAQGTIETLIGWVEVGSDKVDLAEAHINRNSPDAVLRRCEADRRIIARHNLDTGQLYNWTTACDGCGYDDCGPHVENLNDCPELLDLAHALGITPEELQSLDRPVAPEREPYVEVKRTWANIDADQAPATFRP